MAPGNFEDAVTLARFDAGAALDALLLVDEVHLLDGADDRVRGTPVNAGMAAVALLRVDLVFDQGRAYACWADTLADVSLVLVLEILNGRQHRVGGRRAQRTQATILHHYAYLAQETDVFGFSRPLGGPVERIKRGAQALTAGNALAAGLLRQEGDEVA